MNDAPLSSPSAAPHRLTVALAGNPNAGKTTLFNRLTGARQHVGNYPGVTVEKKEGLFRYDGREILVVDLPGTYSLTAASLDERVARQFILHERPDVVVDVVDASNLERHLYLAVQLRELGVPVVLALNMADLADAAGCLIDAPLLERLLGLRIVRTVAHKGEGVAELQAAIVETARRFPGGGPPRPRYDRRVEAEIEALAALLATFGPPPPGLPVEWTALKLLEGDEDVARAVRAHLHAPAALTEAVAAAIGRLEKHFGDRVETILADQRYGIISGACQEAVRRSAAQRHSTSDRIDDIVISRPLGLPIFLLLMYLVFRLTFGLGDPLGALIERGFHWAGGALAAVWPGPRDSAWLSLLRDGVLRGVGSVLVFLPNILLLFAAIAVLEDSGYMARAAFVMDQWMHRIGLHGKSFIPLLLGFGCTVPAVMATRVLESRRDRLVTMLVLPLISCGGRLPIYTMLLGAFFPPAWRTPMLLGLYLFGVALALLLAKLLRSTLWRGEEPLFVMELPPYRLPTVRGVLLHTWERGWLFVRKAATVILGLSIVLWVLTSYPKAPAHTLAGLPADQARAAQLAYSAAGRAGHALEPLLRPAGFDWKAATALLGAFAAKEMFVAQMSIVHAAGDPDAAPASLHATLRRNYTPLQAVAMLLFCLISLPCVMTGVVVARESGAWRWALLQLSGLTLLAYIVAVAVYQTGRALTL